LAQAILAEVIVGVEAPNMTSDETVSPTVAFILAWRGVQLQPEDEPALDRMWCFLEERRQKNHQAQRGRRRLTLDGHLRDWFVPREQKYAHEWVVNSDEDDVQFGTIVGELFTLGIPTFLKEPLYHTPERLMKFFLPFMAPLVCVPGDTDMAKIQECFVVHIIKAMSEIVHDKLQLPDEKMLIAVFNASGYNCKHSCAVLSFRVCFVEIGLDASAARTLKDNTCQLLGRKWAQEENKPWAQYLDKSRLLDAPPVRLPTDNETLWASIVDDKCLLKDTTHTLVYCDSVTEVLPGTLVPDKRPLKPYALYEHVKGETPVNVTARHETALGYSQWVRLGSVWSPNEVATLQKQRAPAAHPGIARPAALQAPCVVVGAPCVLQFASQRQAAATAYAPNQWEQYFDDKAKRNYYYNQTTRESVWELPLGAIVVRRE